MKTKYEFIHFDLIEKKAKTFVIGCYNNSRSGELLGRVKWYPFWRQYCFFPTTKAVYSASCLDDISHFIKQLKKGGG